MNDAFETLLSIVSDLYKDLYGVRPRHLYTNLRQLSYEDLERFAKNLEEEIEIEAEGRRMDEEYEARMDFEAQRLDYLFED